jgi:hypothetical protein
MMSGSVSARWWTGRAVGHEAIRHRESQRRRVPTCRGRDRRRGDVGTRSLTRIGAIQGCSPGHCAQEAQAIRVAHLVRHVRIKHRVDLGFSLPHVAAIGDADDHPAAELRALDDELAASIESCSRHAPNCVRSLDQTAPPTCRRSSCHRTRSPYCPSPTAPPSSCCPGVAYELDDSPPDADDCTPPGPPNA